VTAAAQRLPERWIAAHTAATLAVALYIGYAAWQRGFGALGLALCVGAVLMLTLAPRFPLLGLVVFLAAAYVLPRYGADHVALLELGLLNALAALALSGLLAWRAQPGVAAAPLREWHWALPCMTLFLGWAALSLAFALVRDPDTEFFARHHPAQILQGAVLLALAAFLLSRRTAAMTIGLVLCLLPVLRGFIQGSESIYLDADIAALAVIALPFALLHAFERQALWSRGLAVVLVLALVALIGMAQNRGAVLGLLLMLLALWINSRYRLRWLLVGLALGGALLAAGPTSYVKRFSVLWDPAASHATASLDRSTVEQRLRLWQSAWDTVLTRPILGSGPGREVHAAANRLESDRKLVTHNSFLSAAVETGIVGMMLYAALFLGSLVHLQILIRREDDGWRRRQARMVQAALCAYIGVGLVISRYNMQMAYLLVGWGAALHMAAAAEARLGSAPKRVGTASAPLAH